MADRTSDPQTRLCGEWGRTGEQGAAPHRGSQPGSPPGFSAPRPGPLPLPAAPYPAAKPRPLLAPGPRPPPGTKLPAPALTGSGEHVTSGASQAADHFRGLSAWAAPSLPSAQVQKIRRRNRGGTLSLGAGAGGTAGRLRSAQLHPRFSPAPSLPEHKDSRPARSTRCPGTPSSSDPSGVCGASQV